MLSMVASWPAAKALKLHTSEMKTGFFASSVRVSNIKYIYVRTWLYYEPETPGYVSQPLFRLPRSIIVPYVRTYQRSHLSTSLFTLFVQTAI